MPEQYIEEPLQSGAVENLISRVISCEGKVLCLCQPLTHVSTFAQKMNIDPRRDRRLTLTTIGYCLLGIVTLGIGVVYWSTITKREGFHAYLDEVFTGVDLQSPDFSCHVGRPGKLPDMLETGGYCIFSSSSNEFEEIRSKLILKGGNGTRIYSLPSDACESLKRKFDRELFISTSRPSGECKFMTSPHKFEDIRSELSLGRQERFYTSVFNMCERLEEDFGPPEIFEKLRKLPNSVDLATSPSFIQLLYWDEQDTACIDLMYFIG